MRKHLNTIIFLFSLFFISHSAIAQIGIRAKYFSNSFDNDFEAYINNQNNPDLEFISNGYGIGVDYWFRLKNRRIEFLPELEYGKYNTSGDEETFHISNIGVTKFGINLNTRIYPLDFDGNCDCPTFSNKGTLIKKGFYLEFSPGITTNRLQFTFNNTLQINNFDILYLGYKLGIGTGLDIGLSNLITINPYAMFNFHFNNAEDIRLLSSRFNNSNISQLEMGIRFAIRFDAKKY